MRLLRVLDLEGTSGLVDHHLEPIGKLVHLKYLSLRGCYNIFHFPDSVGNLKQLETLDIAYTRIIKLPQAIIKLRKLQYLRAGPAALRIARVTDIGNEVMEDFLLPKKKKNKRCVWTLDLMAFCFSCCNLESGKQIVADPHGVTGVVVPRGLKNLKALHTLGVVNIAQGKAILDDIRRLTRLRKLAVTGINKKNCQEFCSTLAYLSHLESLSVSVVDSWEEAGLHDCLDYLPSPPKNLQSLKLLKNLGKLPKWITGLHHLAKLKLCDTKLTDVDATTQVLGTLPNLAILRLLPESFQANETRCFISRRKAFPSLTVLELQYENGIELVEFEQGTAPKLELLCSNDITISFFGLSFLQSLKEVLIKKPGYYNKQSVEDLRAQLTKNPNKPVLKFK
ncbi:unnamed protein product [Urochloa humidicola]